MSISKLSQRRHIVIPKNICNKIGIKVGDFIEIACDNNSIILTPKAFVDNDDTLTEAEEKLVAEGIKQLKDGEFLSWDELKNELEL